MDGDGHNKSSFGWTEDSDANAAREARIFDPAAILRAIEEEDDDAPVVPSVSGRTQATAEEDLSAAVRAAMTFGRTDFSEQDEAEDVADHEAGDRHMSADDTDHSGYGYDGDGLDEDGLDEDGQQDDRGYADDRQEGGMLLSHAVDDAPEPEWDAHSEMIARPDPLRDLEERPYSDEHGHHADDGDKIEDEIRAQAEDEIEAESDGDLHDGHDDGHDDGCDDGEDGDDDVASGAPEAQDEEDALAFAPADEEPDDAMPAAAAPLLPAVAYPVLEDLDAPGRKPRIALMGEFSAGKSTLSNLLIGSAPLPTKVTATQLPPVWISWGEAEPFREDIDGSTHPIDIARLAEIDPAETRVIRIFAKSEILEQTDIIDMPGISDPNMSSEVWERVIGKADGVIWCTHATQAWRQSEASVWESLDPKLFKTSLLLVTRFDKLHGETDRARVMRRIERETEGLFSARLPISLTEALAAGEDPELLERCGATAFRTCMADILKQLNGTLGSDPDPRGAEERMRETLARDGQVASIGDGKPRHDITPARILPRRVRPVSEIAPGAVERREHDRGH